MHIRLRIKVKILNKCFEFKMDNKAFESVVTNYLCYNASSAQNRKPVLSCLFESYIIPDEHGGNMC